jgi:hypothetical protein
VSAGEAQASFLLRTRFLPQTGLHEKQHLLLTVPRLDDRDGDSQALELR